ncbi:hypothetical protein MMC07_003011 [Pseudocyphellaria aurata]|nr:hypothetical protein [Pseudocyphellaria aurata]
MTLSHNQQHVKASQTTRVACDGAAGCWDGWMNRREQNHISRPAGRRWTMRLSLRRAHITLADLLIWVLLILAMGCVTADAGDEQGQHLRRSRRGRPMQVEEILWDRSAAPERPSPYLQKRQDLFESPTTPTTTHAGEKQSTGLRRPTFHATATPLTSVTVYISTRDSAASSTSTSSGSDSTTSSSPPVVDSPLPKPFDSGFGTNYTQQSCPTFLRALASNETFTSCMPFSILLQNSVSFFHASSESNTITQSLDASCNVVFPTCRSIMASFARDLQQDSNCGEDFRRQNPLVGQAYNGLIAYETLYYAGCQKNSQGKYCYAEAILNKSSTPVSDSFVYFLPLGIPLPAPSKPSCSQCQVRTMSIFNQAAANTTQPISKTYVDAARMIDLTCGPNFANSTLPAPLTNDGSAPAPGSRAMLVVVTGVSSALGLLLSHSF